MLGVFVTFQYDDDFDRARIEKVAAEARPMFERMPGLRFKAFTVDERARRATNVYVWDSEEAARALFTPELTELVTGLYGVAPKIDYVDIVEFVDNTSSSVRQ